MQWRNRSEQSIRSELKQNKKMKTVHFLLLVLNAPWDVGLFTTDGKELFSLAELRNQQ